MRDEIERPMRLVDAQEIARLKTYRDAVRLCWAQRRRTRMTQRQLAEEIGCYPSHLTDYLSEDAGKREMPAKYIAAFERVCDNVAITQWIVGQGPFILRAAAGDVQ